MSIRGAIQAQLSEIFRQAHSFGYSLEDVMPQEIKKHFTEMTALAEAKAYIKELESREKDLEVRHADLEKDLHAKQDELNDQPADLAALQIDLKQAQQSINYYKSLTEDSEQRANNYQKKLAAVEQAVAVLDDQAQTIERLLARICDHERENLNLSQENNAMVDRYERMFQPYRRTVKEKEAEIRILETRIEELMMEQTHNVQLSEAYDRLIDTLERETAATAKAVNDKSIYIQNTEAFYSALVSEIQPLARFCEHIAKLIKLYDTALQNIQSACRPMASTLPEEIQNVLDLVSEDFQEFTEISDTTSATVLIGGHIQHTIRSQIDTMAESLGHTYLGLDCLGDTILRIVRPGGGPTSPWTQIKTRFTGSSRPPSIVSLPAPEPGSSLSRKSSVSSFANWSKSLALCG